MEKNLNEIYEGLKGDYFVNDAGQIYRKKINGEVQHIKPNPQNKHDRHISVHLSVCSGGKIISDKHFPVRYVVLNAFKGYRGREYKCRFNDGNTHNVHLDNLEWVLKGKDNALSLFEIMTDRELKLWQTVLAGIKDITVMRNKHESWLEEYLKWGSKEVIFNKNEYYNRRMEFFQEMFKGYLK